MGGDDNTRVSRAEDGPIVMGRIAAPYGVKGWLKVVSYTRQPDRLLEYTPWYLQRGTEWQAVDPIGAKRHAGVLLVHLPGCDDRDMAAKLTGTDIGIYRQQLPVADEGEYYWNDLIGLKVVTLDNAVLGTVDHLLETGANDVLVVRGEREFLVPFVRGQVVALVDLENRVLRVDWDPDF
jgi:16S rRNA processing protein RimM